MSSYPQALSTEWFNPKHRKFRHMCCDCNLIHVVDFKVDEKGAIWMRWNPDEKATAAARRKKK
jgi:hypothetical protein